MKLDDCLKEGLLKETEPSLPVAKKSLEASASYIDKAVSNVEMGNCDIAIVCAYTSMFHAARAILFRDGFKERSHICLISYIEERYPQLGSYARQADHYRRARHAVLYGLDSIQTKADAEVAIEAARSFLKKVKPLISGK